jgi:hypothetical protein
MQGKNWFGYDVPRLDQATRIDLIWQIKSYQDMDQELSSRVRHLDLSSEGPKIGGVWLDKCPQLVLILFSRKDHLDYLVGNRWFDMVVRRSFSALANHAENRKGF